MVDRGTGTSHYARVEGTTWPVNVGDVGWQLRYGSSPNLVAASVVSAYAHLTDPGLSEADAIAALRRARKAVANA